MNSELRKALETLTDSITSLKDSNKKLWMTVETMRVRLDALEDSGESVDPDVLESINALQHEDAVISQAAGHKASSNGKSRDPLYSKAVMVVSDSSSGVTSKNLQTLLDCGEHVLKGIRDRMVKEGIAFHPLGGKIYPMVDGKPRGYRNQHETMRPATLQKARDAIMKINIPVVDKSSTDITEMLRKAGFPVSQAAINVVLDKMCEEGLVSSKPNPRFRGRSIYSF